MVKSFSIDWLARSHYDISTEQDRKILQSTPVHLKKHVPCVVQPGPSACNNKICFQSKPNGIGDNDMHKSSTCYSSNPIGSPSPSFSENSGYSSGYESEAATVEGQSIEMAQEGESAERISRRARTKFTSEQIYKLEKTFNKHKYLDPTERIKTAAELNLSETQVRTWFQNRRMKLKREMQDWTHNFTPAVVIPAVFLPRPPAFQHHGSTGQRHPFIPTALASYQRPFEQIPAQQAQHLMHPICY